MGAYSANCPYKIRQIHRANLPKKIRQIVPESIFGKLSFGKLSLTQEELEIEQLVKILEPMKSVTIALQRSDMDMDPARTLFDELLKTVENFDRNKKYIHKNCAIAKNNSFENAIVKLQSGD